MREPSANSDVMRIVLTLAIALFALASGCDENGGHSADGHVADGTDTVETDIMDAHLAVDGSNDAELDTGADTVDLLPLHPACNAPLSMLADPAQRTPIGRDTEGWQPPTPTQLTALAASLEDLGETAVDEYSVCTLGDVRVWVPDPGSGRALIALVPTRRGPEIVLEAPHASFETGTRAQAVSLFEALDARALVVAGTHRCANAQTAGCDGTTSVCGVSEPFRITDMAHSTQTTFQIAHQTLADRYPETVAVNLHGMGGDGVSLSNGVSGAAVTADAPLARFSAALQAELPGERVTSCNAGPNLEVEERLCGTTNVQGRFSNRSPEACGTAASTASQRFLHIEQSRAIRDLPNGLLGALQATF